MRELGCTRLFLAADEALLESELFMRISALLRRSGVSATVFSAIEFFESLRATPGGEPANLRTGDSGARSASWCAWLG